MLIPMSCTPAVHGLQLESPMNIDNDRNNPSRNASGKPDDSRAQPTFADGQQPPGKAPAGQQASQQNPGSGQPQQGQNTPPKPGNGQPQTPQPGQQGQQGQKGQQGERDGKHPQQQQAAHPGQQTRTPAEQGKTGQVTPTPTPPKAAKGDDDLMSKQQQQAMPSGDQIKGEWKQKVGSAKIMWAKLTDDELLKTEGHADKLAGLVQARYAVSRDEADKQIKGFFAKQKS